MRYCKSVLCTMLLLCMICIVGQKQKLYAAGNGYVKIEFSRLDETKTSSEYDVTGDGITDIVQAVIRYNQQTYSYSLKVMINNVPAFEESGGEGEDAWWKIGIFSMQDGKVFFDISRTTYGDYVVTHGLYEYADGELKWLYDMKKDNRYSHRYDANIYKIDGNKIYTNVSAQYFTTGWIGYKMVLQYEGGRIKSLTKTSSIILPAHRTSKKWTTNKKIKVYKKAGKKNVLFTLKKGDKIKINKITFKGDKVYFQIKNNKGKTGYIPAAKKYPAKMYFLEAHFAG